MPDDPEEYLAKFESDVRYYRVKNAKIPEKTKRGFDERNRVL